MWEFMRYKQTLLIVVRVGFVLSLALVSYLIFQGSVQEDVTLSKPEQASLGLATMPVGKPVRLKIPEINVDSAIESLGLAIDGAMDVPEGPRDVAWFNIGPRPGENGSAVIAGHYGTWVGGAGSVFDDLNKLKKGDKLYVEYEKGIIITFVVRESRTYDPKADASDVFGSNDENPHLNLITCDGIWNKVSKSYSERLVVFTDKE